MNMYSRVFSVAALAVALAFTPSLAAAQGATAKTEKAAAPAPAPDVRAFVQSYCVGCHNERNKAQVANLSLDGVDPSSAGKNGHVWEKVVMKLRAGQMPPVSARRPDPTLSASVATWLENELDQNAAAHPNPGRKESLHRLNRTEYKNAVRDLLALDIDVQNMLPPDPLGGGDANFDNIASSLRMSQSLLERYITVARRVSRTAMSGNVPSNIQTFRAPEGVRQDIRLDGMPFGTRGGLGIDYVFPLDAVYKFDIALGSGLCCDVAGFSPRIQAGETLELSLDGEAIKEWVYETPTERGQGRGRVTVEVPVKAGPHRILATFRKSRPTFEQAGDRLAFINQFLPGNSVPPGVSTVVVTGPLQVLGKGDTESRRKVLTCTPSSAADEEPCARKILAALARRGFRRTATDDDLQYLMRFFKEGRAEGDFDAGIERAIRALLVSPEFLFRIETDPAGIAPGAAYRVSDLDLASRLSFFLWSSIPDDELLDVAVKGQLKQPAVLEKQVRRMLRDPRSVAMTQSFASFYLWIRNVADTQMDVDLYPNYDGTLRQAMARETELFFDSIRVDDKSVLQLLDADYTFLNERLAKHYGISGVSGPDFRRVSLSADSPRRGIFGKASILLVTSVPTRTSPVKRGKWILDNVLGTPPPAPPANIPPLGEQKQDDGRVLTLRELMAKHRNNPVCAGCHNTIDPLGFALEQFDAVGRYRQVDRSFAPIDPSGTMPNGAKFGSLAEFRQQITGNPGPFLRTFTEKMLIYALGRPFESYDAPAVRQVLRGAAPGNYKFSDIVLGVVKSQPFQMRRAPQVDNTRSAN
jgi:mono/diheme cytochrome c family protein